MECTLTYASHPGNFKASLRLPSGRSVHWGQIDDCPGKIQSGHEWPTYETIRTVEHVEFSSPAVSYEAHEPGRGAGHPVLVESGSWSARVVEIVDLSAEEIARLEIIAAETDADVQARFDASVRYTVNAAHESIQRGFRREDVERGFPAYLRPRAVELGLYPLT
jgi:hypothetical protein